MAYVLGETEIHVNADVAIAQWQYYLATHDREWLRAHGWPVIREVARFWASRASYDPRGHRYEIAHVNSVAESNTDIPNDTFTNLSAAKALSIATAAAGVLGERPDPLWSRIARGLYIRSPRAGSITWPSTLPWPAAATRTLEVARWRCCSSPRWISPWGRSYGAMITSTAFVRVRSRGSLRPAWPSPAVDRRRHDR